VNGCGAGIVAEACREVGAAMVYVSSNEVFDGEKGAPYGEDDATNAVNAYAASKLEVSGRWRRPSRRTTSCGRRGCTGLGA